MVGADLASLRAAWWTFRSIRRARRRLRRWGIDAALQVSPPPRLPPEARRGVNAIMARFKPSCLERAIVVQAWHDAQGERRDLIIGVSPRSEGFQAHAWLDGEDPCHPQTRFHELLRRSPH